MTTACLRTTLLIPALLSLAACDMMQSTTSRPNQERSAPASAPASKPVAAAKPAPAGAGHPVLSLTSARGKPGATVGVNATLDTAGISIAGTQNDIVFDPAHVAIAQRANGKPDCRANGQLSKEGTAFSFLPSGCRGASCTGVRALVLSLSNVDPIPNGSVLYTCTAQITPKARPGTHRLEVTRVGFSSPTGQAISGGNRDGSVTVE
jgi:hypothetical protein